MKIHTEATFEAMLYKSLFEFKRRTLVHFAADPDLVFMTTRLAGSANHFLPFNRGGVNG